MKRLLIWLVLGNCTVAGAQVRGQLLQKRHNETPALLARQITSGCKTEKQKVTAIFNWITDNISYRVRSWYAGKYRGQLSEPATADTGAYKSANEMVAETVLRNGSAVCDGYARLFTSLCDYSGIRSAVVTGYARTNLGHYADRFSSNHTWNAVRIDSNWYLLDVTWASGYTGYQGYDFVARHDDFYFLTPPEIFILDHFPDEMRWTLLKKPPAPGEFRKAPYRQRAYIKYDITGFEPAQGILEANTGDTVRIVLWIGDAAHDRTIAADTSAPDSAAAVGPQVVVNVYGKVEKGRVMYELPVLSPETEWVQVIYNGDIVLRYKLKQCRELAGRPDPPLH